MAIALILEELIGPSLQEAREEIQATFKTPEELRRQWQEALSLPKVQEFRLGFEDYLQRSGQLAEQLAGDTGIIINAVQRKNTAIRHAWQVSAVCNHLEHDVPKVVAIASIPATETEGLSSPEEAIRNRRFTHADLTHSYHNERIDEQGRIICREHGVPAMLEVSAKVHRVVPRSKLQPQKVEDALVEGIAAKFFYSKGNNHQNGKHKRTLEEVKQGLEVLLRVGKGGSGIYDSTYDALEQTRHRAVTMPHIAKNADLDRLSDTFKRLIGYDAEARLLTPEQLAQRFRSTQLFKFVQEFAKNYIPSPVVVTQQRTKGQTLVDKLTVALHHSQLLEAFNSGELKAYFRKLGIEVPDEMKDNPPNLDDIVGVKALVHGDSMDYDPLDFRTGTPQLSAEEVGEVRAKCYRVLAAVADIPAAMMGYERMRPKDSPNGKMPRTKQRRMPPDPSRPKFSGLDQKRPNGLVVNLTPAPEGRFDDYIVAPKGSGYMALHLPVGSTNHGLEGAVIELQIKPNVIDTFERLAQDESHERYKLQRAAQISYLLATGLMSRMEWEMNKLLLTPPGKTYVETGLIATNGNGKNGNGTYSRKPVAAVTAAK